MRMSKYVRVSVGMILILALVGMAEAGPQNGEIDDTKRPSQQSGGQYNKDYYEAEIRYGHQLLTLTEKALGPDNPTLANTLSKLASLYQATGAFAKSAELYERAAAIRGKVLGLEHPDTALSLNRLALVYKTAGDYSSAEPLYQRALKILEKVKGPEHEDTALVLNNLAALYRQMGAYDQAEPLYKRALSIREKVLGSQHPDTALSLNQLGELYRATGVYSRAESLYKRALAIQEVLGPEETEMAVSLHNLAELYQATGAYSRAESLYQRALAILEKTIGSEQPDVAAALNSLAGFYIKTGTYLQAVPLYRRALAITETVLGREHPDTAVALGNFARLYTEIGAYDKAEPLLQRALAISEKVLGPAHQTTAATYAALGLLYEQSGAYEKAEAYSQVAQDRIQKALGPDHFDSAIMHNNLANLYNSRGAHTQATNHYERGLAILEKAVGSEHPVIPGILGNLASSYWASDNLTAALVTQMRAQTILGKNLVEILPAGSETRKRAYVDKMYGIIDGSISLSLAISNKLAKELGLNAILQTKGRVLEIMSDSIGRLQQSGKPEDRQLVEELATVVEQLSTLMYQGLETLQPETYHRRFQELADRKQQLEGELATRSAEFRLQITPITIETVRSGIPYKAALLEWFRYRSFDPQAKNRQSEWGKPRYVAYVLKANGELAAVDVGDAETIERLVQDFRTGLNDPKNTYVQEVAKELSDRLLKPLQQHLGNVEHLLISPDGALNLVPFAALVDEKGMYLGVKVSITYLTSGRDLVRLQTTFAGKGDAVIVADPSYGEAAAVVKVKSSDEGKRSVDLDRGSMRFTPLPGTAEEAMTLKALLKISDDRVLTQAKATEDRFKLLYRPRILHVATHGFFLKDNDIPNAALRQASFGRDQLSVALFENPLLRSGLSLAGANLRHSGENEDDGILTAAEVAQMDLRGTQLVVLSACETGVGDVQNGEGVYGLRRALVLAGAETQVTSLWKVADEGTKDFMVDYYKRLLNGEGRSEALRHTQFELIKSKNRSHPYYWAAFVPIGNWTPLAKSH